ncbi:ras GTPase-activating protein-binding protein 2-like isoform X2 [Ornithodoros turicata]|uniref:ras GTPase-activating protein-binding protein 2-like isoform X2 n=1 Tax=Ornithodoros turicata TaxID=34597 RepID=UPI00313981A4
MVMETPNAVCIGREFVRQYYTVLNKSPECLHRFYSQDSSFVHGGSEKTEKGSCVTGQQDIHWRIMQLDFRDCHAKIRQVDSHSTLGDGVVVQVTGELSNAGQPMRRFMQTFVLAPQTPRKYYVRNDIFCYQDEVFTDNEDENGDEAVTCVQDGGEETSAAEEAVPHEMTNGVPPSPSSPPQAATAPYYEQQELVRNGTSQTMEVLSAPSAGVQQAGHTTADVTSPVQQQVVLSDSSHEVAAQPSNWEEEEPAPVATTLASGNTSQTSQEAKTYANMVSKNSAPGFTSLNQTPPAPFGGAIHVTSAPVASLPRFTGEVVSGGLPPRDQPPQQQRFVSGAARTRNRGAGMGQTPPRRTEQQREVNQQQQSSPPGGDEGLGSLGAPQRKTQYPDTQQVFVGNLHHSIREDEVKQRFAEFGKVLEFRINSKPNAKMPGGKVVPNCGFVVFDSPEAVQAVLEKNKEIKIGDHRLNVEEKKTKQRLAETRGVAPFSVPPQRGGGSGGNTGSAGGRGRGIGGRGGTFSRGSRNASSYVARH